MKQMSMLMFTKGTAELMLLISSFKLSTRHIKCYCFVYSNYTSCRIRVAAAAAASSMARAPSIRRLTAQKVQMFRLIYKFPSIFTYERFHGKW